MAKKTPTPINRPEQKSAFVMIFSNIKNFFQSIVDKFKEIFEYAKRLHTKFGDSVEGKAAEQANHQFQASDEIYKNAESPPGFDNMSLEHGGYVKIPQGTESIWHIDDKYDIYKYLNAIHTKFPYMEDPTQTHQGEFISDIARTLEVALHKHQDVLQMYVVGKFLIVAQVEDGKASLMISDGENTHTKPLEELSNLRMDIASFYATTSECNTPANFYIDTKNNVRYMQLQNDEHGYDTYIAEPMKRHINDYGDKQGVSHRFVMPGVIEVQGPDVLPRDFLDKVIAMDTPMEWKDFANIMTAMHESMFTTEEQKGHIIRTAQNCQSVYITSDKMFWLTQDKNGEFVAHVAPAHCKYPGVATIDVPVPEEALSWSKEGQKALSRAVNKACSQLNKIIIDLDAKSIEADKFEKGLNRDKEHEEENKEEPEAENTIDDDGAR